LGADVGFRVAGRYDFGLDIGLRIAGRGGAGAGDGLLGVHSTVLVVRLQRPPPRKTRGARGLTIRLTADDTILLRSIISNGAKKNLPADAAVTYIINRRPTGYEHTQAGRGLIIYFDSCIYGRPNDNQTQPDIKAETMAIDRIIDICNMTGHIFIGSNTVEDEILANSNATDRTAVLKRFNDTVMYNVTLTAADIMRAYGFMAQGLGKGDSLHLAAAEAANADVLLTVDKDFIRIATNNKLKQSKGIKPITIY